MSVDWGHRLQDWAYKVIKDDVGLEFEGHLNDWKTYTNRLLDCADEALTSHQGHLEAIKEELKAERQRQAQLAMFVLSLMSGPALSFVSAALEHRLSGKLFGAGTHSQTLQVPNPHYAPSPFVPKAPPTPSAKVNMKSGRVKAEDEARTVRKVRKAEARRASEDYNRAKATDTVYISHKDFKRQVFDPTWANTKGQMLGDLSGKFINDFLVNPALQAPAANQTALNNAINRVPDSLDLGALRTSLDEVWRTAMSTGKQAMQFFANTIRDDSTWGDRLWKILGDPYGTNIPSMAQMMRVSPPSHGTSDLGLFDIGTRWIRSIVDKQRETWAKQKGWFYYGNAPPPFYKAHTTNAIEAEMWALWIAQEDFRPIIYYDQAEGLGHKRMGKIEKGEIYENLQGRSRVPIDKLLTRLRRLGILEGAHWPEKWRRASGGPLEQPGILAVEINDIYGEVDTAAELNSIRNWAANRKPMIFGGQLGSVRRPMGPLVISGGY